MDLNCIIASLLIFQFNHLCEVITAQVLNSYYAYYRGDENPDSTITPHPIQSLVTHAITDKEAYVPKRSNKVMLVISCLITRFFMQLR